FHAPMAAAAHGDVGDVDGALTALAAAAAAAPADQSMADMLSAYLPSLSGDALTAARRAIDLDLDLENGVAHHELSVRALDEPGVGDGDRWLPDGYGALFTRIAAGVDVRLGQVVRRIEWDAAGVRVTVGDSGAPVIADCCVCTVPVWLLADLELSPGLPARHVTAIDRLAVGVVEKVVLRFDERWWPSAPNGYLRWYDDPASWGEWLDLTDEVGAPVVAGLIAGDAVRRQHHGRDDSAVAMAAADALGRWAAAVRRGP
ncbi:MAG TPA: FAD-dependent oxidoreductase, partial [Ilumatobacteraceae bacterium]|nr:FAD-dependent oxidoreductase [Ilumatobacteraceae bacterium]